MSAGVAFFVPDRIFAAKEDILSVDCFFSMDYSFKYMLTNSKNSGQSSAVSREGAVVAHYPLG